MRRKSTLYASQGGPQAQSGTAQSGWRAQRWGRGTWLVGTGVVRSTSTRRDATRPPVAVRSGRPGAERQRGPAEQRVNVTRRNLTRTICLTCVHQRAHAHSVTSRSSSGHPCIARSLGLALGPNHVGQTGRRRPARAHERDCRLLHTHTHVALSRCVSHATCRHRSVWHLRWYQRNEGRRTDMSAELAMRCGRAGGAGHGAGCTADTGLRAYSW